MVPQAMEGNVIAGVSDPELQQALDDGVLSAKKPIFRNDGQTEAGDSYRQIEA